MEVIGCVGIGLHCTYVFHPSTFLDLAVQLLFVAGPALLCSVQHEDLDLDWMSYRMARALPRMRGCMYLTN